MNNFARPTHASSDLLSFQECLAKATSIVALVGAGLSAPSGLSTFNSTDGIWSVHEAATLATPEAFASDPRRVWQFYAQRRQDALDVHPNAGHYALAEASKRNAGWTTLSQNVDGLSERAGHPLSQLILLHGTLFDVRCSDPIGCGYSSRDLANASTKLLESGDSATTNNGICCQQDRSGKDLEVAGCPQCNLPLRPGVVWYGEKLDAGILEMVRECFSRPDGIDIMLVVGTSAEVYPAAGYINVARARGARICVLNADANVKRQAGLRDGDWFFEGDASELLPILLEPIIATRG
ncbi:NAD-dependent protein deacylase sirtuin-5, mitochondrial [Cercospora beticola]|uniref:NAD-dependent protein deacylase sirtuin-5, mitochondrial n=1 Tax=Cercospora beticola TaxID=122368 RepID=A0A2G5HMF1_CERBT|nr:NAD-dependent protein deacylase sirtuin-5, mitochondrial [Cercospora beticola]PIA93727.1 NAD-dependent protein deacylase sirtuin-5, mitochondrial [Cercospora beticola]WPB01336.1 hypothetical protein RHO25_005960 [Cercospora beticola]